MYNKKATPITVRLNQRYSSVCPGVHRCSPRVDAQRPGREWQNITCLWDVKLEDEADERKIKRGGWWCLSANLPLEKHRKRNARYRNGVKLLLEKNLKVKMWDIERGKSATKWSTSAIGVTFCSTWEAPLLGRIRFQEIDSRSEIPFKCPSFVAVWGDYFTSRLRTPRHQFIRV